MNDQPEESFDDPTPLERQQNRDVAALQNAKLGPNPSPFDYWMAACAYARTAAESRLAALERDGERTLNIARGCLDYGGGYRGDPILMGAFHHGIQTVINALEAAAKRDPKDTQVNALERIGHTQQADAATGKTEGGK